jgi:hypothetical protein
VCWCSDPTLLLASPHLLLPFRLPRSVTPIPLPPSPLLPLGTQKSHLVWPASNLDEEGKLVSRVVDAPDSNAPFGRQQQQAGLASANVSVALMRTPYCTLGLSGRASGYAASGYVAVTQDMRGRFLSNGSYAFFRASGNDTWDTMNWIATTQPWYSGTFGSFGVSADAVGAYTSNLGSSGAVPGYAAQESVVGTALFHQEAYQGGAYREGLVSGWLTVIGEASYVPTAMAHEGWGQYWSSVSIARQPVPPPNLLPGPFTPAPGSMWDRMNYPGVHVAGWVSGCEGCWEGRGWRGVVFQDASQRWRFSD